MHVTCAEQNSSAAATDIPATIHASLPVSDGGGGPLPASKAISDGACAQGLEAVRLVVLRAISLRPPVSPPKKAKYSALT